jgi:hypothetical protein
MRKVNADGAGRDDTCGHRLRLGFVEPNTKLCERSKAGAASVLVAGPAEDPKNGGKGGGTPSGQSLFGSYADRPRDAQNSEPSYRL